MKTINNQLSAILNYAVKFYNLPGNPMHKTGSIGKKNADTMNFWTVDEFNKFIDIVSEKPPSDRYLICCFGQVFGLARCLL